MPCELSPHVLIFHHLTKTGGTSLRNALHALYGADGFVDVYAVEKQSEPWFRAWRDGIAPERWSRIRCIAGHQAGALIPLLDGPRAFSIVRDPVERVVSLYSYLTARYDAGIARNPAAVAIRARGWTLADIYRYAEEAPPELQVFFNGQTRAIAEPAGLQPLPFAPVAPADVPHAVASLERTLDAHYRLGAQERHAASVARFARELGWGDLRTGRDNVTASRPAVDDLPAGVAASILAYNQLDAALHARALREIDEP
ncbi:MAG TPA: sulfotransferase family 2 domain-containing protein [Candidatus Elarobacter sp.]|nr:sulfotransferase family 2 domain-containing protein [Candidatus Elarobacter sp.]